MQVRRLFGPVYLSRAELGYSMHRESYIEKLK